MKRLISIILTLTILMSIASISFVTSGAATNPYVTDATVELITSNVIGKTFIKPDGSTCKLTDLVDTEMVKPMFTCNYPYVFEGACSDGTDYYFTVAFQVPVTTDKTPADYRKNGYMIKYDVSADKWYVSDPMPIGHSNDICYNADTKQIVSCNYAPAENYVDIINTDLTYSKRVAIKDASGNALKISQICYDATNNRYLVTSRYKISGYYYHFVLNSSFKYVKKFKRLAKPEDSAGNQYGTQGLDCTKNYVFLTYSDNYDKTDNKIIVMDWSGNKIQTITIPVQNEIEDMFCVGNVFYMNFHWKAAGGYFYKVALTDYTIKYNANGGTGTMADSIRHYGFNEAFTANSFKKTGYHFTGWTAHRKSDNKWYYRSADNSKKGWYVEGSQPSGYVKYIYADKKASCTQSKVNGDVITLYAQWELNTYTLKFNANGGTGTMANQTISYGVSGQNITANAFTRSGYTFAGWTAYRASDKKWYCKSSDGSKKGWYITANIPSGYVKYTYKNKQSVAKQSAVNKDVVTLYAQWN